MSHHNIKMIEIVAQGLGSLCEEVVFVGGVITFLYIDDSAAIAIRPTTDVDCVFEIASIASYHKLEQKLRSLGFGHDFSNERSLVCRWKYKDIIVDIMTTDSKITGFTNKWYLEGMNNKVAVQLPSGKQVFVLALPYYIATKFEAFHDRGSGDYRMSHDIEDIITVLDGSNDLTKFSKVSQDLKLYLYNELSALQKSNESDEIFYSHLSRIGNMDERAIVFGNKIKSLVEELN